MDDEPKKAKGGEEIRDLALCEVYHLVLKPGALYRFSVIEGCKECERLAEEVSE